MMENTTPATSPSQAFAPRWMAMMAATYAPVAKKMFGPKSNCPAQPPMTFQPMPSMAFRRTRKPTVS